MGKILVAPDGAAITGSLETIPGVALIQQIRRLPDGRIDIDYGGETAADWDTNGSSWTKTTGNGWKVSSWRRRTKAIKEESKHEIGLPPR